MITYIDREYQDSCIEAIFREWYRGVRSTMIEMATGTGKTVIFSRVIKQAQPKRALVLAHRTELIAQAKEKIEAITGLECEIEKADMYATTNWMTRAPVVISSIQTQCSGPKDRRRYRRFDPKDFGVLIADECHHSTANTWRETIDWYLQNPELRVLGVTATADRTDREALGQLFETCAFKYGILDAIEDGYLVPITQHFVPVASLDYSNIKTTCGDLNEGQLARVMQHEKNIYGVCQPTIEAMFGLEPKTLHSKEPKDWRDFLKGTGRKPRRTIIFTVSVEQAEAYCNVFLRAMDGVDWVCGKTSDQKRLEILNRFSRGEISACVNCMVLTEGYDNPGVEMIVMARPTKSRALYTQMVGRSTRPLAGVVDDIPVNDIRREMIKQSAKPFCRVLDFVGNSGKHKLITCMDILGGKVSERASEIAKANALRDGKPKMVTIALSNAEKEAERERQAQMERERNWREAGRAHLMAHSNYRLTHVDPFGHKHEFVPIHKRQTRDGKIFSQKQAQALQECGCDPNRLNYRQGQAIIAKRPPSDKQIAALKSKGVDPTGWTRKQCSKKLDELYKQISKPAAAA